MLHFYFVQWAKEILSSFFWPLFEMGEKKNIEYPIYVESNYLEEDVIFIVLLAWWKSPKIA